MKTTHRAALATGFALVLACVSCAGDLAPAPTRFDLQLVQAAAGRIVLTGRAPAPDGTWVYLEITGDPGRFDALWGEAVPIYDGRFAQVVPFTEPLVYHARAILSPKLNPKLAAAFEQIPEHPGVEILKTDAGPEIVTSLKTSVGSPAERAASHHAIIADLRTWERALAKDLDALADGPPQALPETWRRFSRERDRLRGATPGRLLYAPTVGADLIKWVDDLDDLMRLRMARAAGESDSEAWDKALRSAKNRAEAVAKRIGDLDAAMESDAH